MRSSERRAVMRLWHRVVFLSLGGMFLAELFVMWFLDRLGVRWGFPGALVDALLLTMLVLPILYFTALQPPPVQRVVRASKTRFRKERRN